MELEKLKQPLPIESIDFRVQSINRGGYATILAYKDARVDMNRLDEVCGPLNWKREHVRDNQNCIVSIWDEAKKEWVSKEDTGTESFTEKEKGLASDSFKRACFNWGIGRELYDYPVIQIKLNSDEFELQGDKAKATYKLNIRRWNWQSKWEGDKLLMLVCTDDKGKKRYDFGDTSKMEIDETVKESVKNAVGECKTIAAITKMWNNNKELQKEQWFITLLTGQNKLLIENGIES
jgi:hypothetical protein